MTTQIQPLVELDESGVAWILGEKVKVIELALDKLAHGTTPEEMHTQFPHLSIAQIYAGLAYYYEHQVELDAEIQKRWDNVNQLASSGRDSPLQVRLRELRKGR